MGPCVCTHVHTPPNIHQTLPHLHTTPHTVAYGHTWDGRTGGESQPDPLTLTFWRSDPDAASEPGRWAPHQILQCGGASQAVIPRVPGSRDGMSCAHRALPVLWRQRGPGALLAAWGARRKEDCETQDQTEPEAVLASCSPWTSQSSQAAGCGQVERREPLA